MAITSLLSRHIGGLTFDAIVSEDHSSEMEITDNPVELGVSITDHAYVKPYALVIEAGVSAVQLRPTGDPFGSGDERVGNAFQALLDLQATREPFDVQTGLKLYRNMLLQSINATQDKDTSRVLAFRATLREIVIVYTESVKYPPRKQGTTKNQASKKKDQGEKQGKDAKATGSDRQSVTTKKGSLASKTLDVLTKGLGR